jgi:hypothetical protein
MSVEHQVEHIKKHMPTVYGMITDKAKEIGNDAYGHVRAGLRGDANRFYAFERGHVVGTPFNITSISSDVATLMVKFGVNAVAIWAPVQTPAPAALPNGAASCK